MFHSLPCHVTAPGEGQVHEAQIHGIVAFQGAPNRRLLPLYGLMDCGEGKREGLGMEGD